MSESILYIETPNGETYGVGPTKVSQLENDSGFTTFNDLNNNPRVTNAITSWLNENLTGDSSIAIDSSLSVSNAAADAKAVGDALSIKFELPQGGQTGWALLNNGEGKATWGPVQTEKEGIVGTLQEDGTLYVEDMSLVADFDSEVF